MTTATDPSGVSTTPQPRPASARVRRLGQVAPYGLLVAAWLAAYPFTQHYGNPDGPSYVAVARLWLAGDWAAAINAYWGPLLSWLTVPLLAVGVPGLLALRLVLLGGGLLTLAPLRSLADRAGASAAATDVLLLAVAPFLVYNALFGLYPDVLLAAALLRCCDLLLRPSFGTSRRTAFAAGAWGGVAYLAKAYAVPVVLVLLPLGALLHLLGDRGGVRRLLRPLTTALLGFLAVFGAWAGTLSVSYGTPTFSTSAGFNARLVGPTSAGNPFNHPGLYEPTRAGALSAWEEPSQLPIPQRDSGTAVDDGEPGADLAGAVAHRLETGVGNARIVAGSVLRRGAPFALLAMLAVGWHLRRRRLPDPALAGSLLAGAVYAGGLLLVIAIERYLWFPILATVPAAAVGLDLAVRGRRRALPAAAAVLVAVLTATSLHGLLPRWNTHREVTRAAAALESGNGLSGTVAAADSWQETHLLCFHVGCRYLGRPVAEDAGSAADELHAAGVDHLVVWDGDGDAIRGLPPPRGSGLVTVYDVTPDGLVAGRSVEAP